MLQEHLQFQGTTTTHCIYSASFPQVLSKSGPRATNSINTIRPFFLLQWNHSVTAPSGAQLWDEQCLLPKAGCSSTSSPCRSAAAQKERALKEQFPRRWQHSGEPSILRRYPQKRTSNPLSQKRPLRVIYSNCSEWSFKSYGELIGHMECSKCAEKHCRHAYSRAILHPAVDLVSHRIFSVFFEHRKETIFKCNAVLQNKPEPISGLRNNTSLPIKL